MIYIAACKGVKAIGALTNLACPYYSQEHTQKERQIAEFQLWGLALITFLTRNRGDSEMDPDNRRCVSVSLEI